jgi:hypothetical protein
MISFSPKTLLISIIFALFINKAEAQKNKKWIYEIGINSVDVREYSVNLSSNIQDFLNPEELFENTNFFISRITAEKFINNNYSIQLAGSVNNLKTIVTKDDSDESYFSLDVNLKYYLNNIFNRIAWFSPYVLGGSGYQSIGRNGDIVLIGGFGSSFWINNKIGLNIQTSYKHGFNHEGRDVFQHSVGMVFNFGADSDKWSRKRLWGTIDQFLN